MSHVAVWVFAVLVNTTEGQGWIFNPSMATRSLPQCLQLLPAAAPLIEQHIVENYAEVQPHVLTIKCLTPGQVQERNDYLESI